MEPTLRAIFTSRKARALALLLALALASALLRLASGDVALAVAGVGLSLYLIGVAIENAGDARVEAAQIAADALNTATAVQSAASDVAIAKIKADNLISQQLVEGQMLVASTYTRALADALPQVFAYIAALRPPAPPPPPPSMPPAPEPPPPPTEPPVDLVAELMAELRRGQKGRKW